MRRFLFLMTFGLMGAGILISLCVWQVQRLAWKQDLLARIDAQIAAAPTPVAEAVEPQFQRYAPVEAAGTFGADHIRMLASRKTTGAVHRIIRPFETETYGRVLVDTGWLPDEVPVPGAPEQRLTIVGNLDAPNEADGFTPEPDLANNLWFARDVPAMADVLGTQPILIVLRDAPEIDLGVTPWPVDTAGIPNDHLQYAITWFSLAAIWVLMTAYFVLRTNRSPR
ncbi:SURF1 family protein [Tateyamaria omphalii]|uniref:SURF1 family protein n=1 Tax=Tateyamaria omphalii TaxID=299262 RepID=UPI001C99436C|nr:SURF1 family protein [Tateyamaria omphalii]MBY5931880.1 SURF1 family protein [Tateyamaria omphalii]